MAAYASLVSLMDLIEQIQRHPNPPLSLHPKQAKSLTDNIRFLQRFLEDFHSRGFSQEIQSLESRIRDVAHAAEDVIEFPMQDMDRKLSTGSNEDLQRVIQDMELVKKEVMDTEKKKQRVEDDDDKLRRHSMRPPSSLGSENTTTTMVGFDHILIQVMDRLTRKQSRRDIIPLVGMGGSGKTTLARNIYENQLIVEHFHARSWATISQECVVREVLIDFLLCLSNQKSREELRRKSEEYLGEQLHKSLYGRKYLVVLDDLWSLEAWNKLKFFFPDQNNVSWILITTRLSNLAFELTGSRSHLVNVDLLDDDTSWDLLYKKVFADKMCPCPSELVEIGRKIARNCRGLPLSIVTIGGHLAMSSMTRDYWEHVAENLSSLVNSDDNHRCLKILSLSYVHLPVHLKPCFLYMGLFPEDKRIEASHLIRLWVAEGILKPIGGRTLEEVGKEYLKDLVERNLVLVHAWKVTGEIELCGLHDLLRDLCIREAQKEKFFFVAKFDELQGEEIYNTTRRLAIQGSISNWADSPHYGASYSAPFLRSCIFESEIVSKLISLRSARLLRIFSGFDIYTDCDVDDIVLPVNLRCLCSFADTKDCSSLWSMSWNLQTLIMDPIRNVTLTFGKCLNLGMW